ncbi:MAG: hypothetical protein IPJ19_13660 [Planctomycetes bacterium]|nr:hypothetical protein [Planctomycetota bacterium]
MRGFFDSVRSQAQIEAEIDAELEFHLAERARELVEQGVNVEEARTQAQRRFGSLADVRRRCRNIQMGERIMLQRINFVLNVVLVVAIVLLGWSAWRGKRQDAQVMAALQAEVQKLSSLLEPRAAALAPPQQPLTPDPMLVRFGALKTSEEATAFATQLAALEPRRGRDLICAGWSAVTDGTLRLALLRPFVEGGGHGEAIELLDLAASDPDPDVRAFGFECLRNYAWQDFADRPRPIYREWFERVRDLDLHDALEYSVDQYHRRLRAAQGTELLRELGFIEVVDLQPATARGFDALHDLWWSGGEAGNILDRAPAWLRSEDPELREAAERFIAHFTLVCDEVPGMLREAKKR